MKKHVILKKRINGLRMSIEESKAKALSLYRYLKDLSSLKVNTVKDIKTYDWYHYFSNIPNDPENIFVSYRDREKDDNTSDLDVDNDIVSVKKPEFDKCPNCPLSLAGWINPGWEHYLNSATKKDVIVHDDKKIEKFTDSVKRISDFNEWIVKRNEWQHKQIKIKATRDFFNKLYQLHVDLNRESEIFELVVANGFITVTDDTEINHPILLKRVTTELDAEKNIIKICDTEIDSELYTSILNNVEDINLSAINELKSELKEKYYHPLDRNDAYDFLKILLHKLSPKSKFIDEKEKFETNFDDKIYLKINPVIFKRKRTDGTIKTLEEIINNIERTNFIPRHIVDIVKGGKLEIEEDDFKEPTIDELLAATSGESSEILLSKEANKEQLEIAKRIEKYNAVCVQGPPGTGKTHTIANLLGHFLAQGKNVLVTSHTAKALKVLKEKVAPGLQNLCVTVLDDKNTDMERSIDGISEYLSKSTSFELERKMSNAKNERKEIMKKLADIRKQIFMIKNLEFEPITYNGESYSPSKAAAFVSTNAEQLSYIPGKVELRKLIPLTNEELTLLYQSNIDINEDEEEELQYDIPNPNLIMPPTNFISRISVLNENESKIKQLEEQLNIELSYKNNKIVLNRDNLQHVLIENPNIDKLDEFLKFVSELGKIKEWMIHAIVDGNKGSGNIAKWKNLINSIEETVTFAESFVEETVAKIFNIPEKYNIDEVIASLENIDKILLQKGKLSWFDTNFNNEIKYILENFKINNKILSTYEDANLMTKKIKLIKKRNDLKNEWNYLIAIHNFTKFEDLDKETGEPERVASNFIKIIKRCLNFYSEDIVTLKKHLSEMGLNSGILFIENDLDSELNKTKKYLNFLTEDLPQYINISKSFIQIQNTHNEFANIKSLLLKEKRKCSNICNLIIKSIDDLNTDTYNDSYLKLSQLFEKYELLNKRTSLLEKLKLSAPDWAAAIKNRIEIHGLPNVPDSIHNAWKWKQLAGIIDEITSKPFEELQIDCAKYNKELRLKTAQCCEYSAWYHLLKMTETDLDMKQALQGWKKTIKKIGKGTGKNVPIYRREAKKLMARCQKAVPAWIMPMNKALETLVPGENLFDIIIIDEASQSDITALAIGYMAKKLIIVGDDKQVSPLAVGTQIAQMNNLMNMHIKDIIPNWQLYEAKTSLYEIAETTFQPLMLKEHFRCVPEIIGFSNKISYGFDINPLRDASSSEFKPATISYRIDGERSENEKTNILEAKYIVSLMLACFENEKYENSTFGVISLLGKEQAALIQKMLLEKLDNTTYEKHKILCGDASNFQGDERDIVFLSMVDSNNIDGPLKLLSEGSGDSRKQRYNVAASRAKNQMWLVHSLDVSKDLKEGDLRRQLIEYMQNPNDYLNQIQKIEQKSESPFEEEVSKTLVARGYNVTQQWKVGSYRIDMVISYQDKKIALECDGEQFHSGELKIREDMERQTILERLGWKFIRIRGSEYYRNKEATINRVIAELIKNKIYQEQKVVENVKLYYEEIDNIKIRAEQIRTEWDNEQEEIEIANSQNQNQDAEMENSYRQRNLFDMIKNNALYDEKKSDN